MVVVIQMIRRLLLARQRIKRRSIHHENIRPAVIVVVKNCHAGSGRLDDKFLRIHSAERIWRAEPRFCCLIHEVRDFFLPRARCVLRRSAMHR